MHKYILPMQANKDPIMDKEDYLPSGHVPIYGSETGGYVTPPNDAVNFKETFQGPAFPRGDVSKPEVRQVLDEYYKSEEWKPDSEERQLWRYLDLKQLLSIIQRGQLWFTDISEFNDPYEGILPEKNLDCQEKRLSSEFDVNGEKAKGYLNWYRADLDTDPPEVNCWNCGEKDSAALWEKYAPGGVAIQTSVEKLKSSLQTEVEVMSGEVEYEKYREEIIPSGRWPRFFFKRKSFRHEDEFRLAITEEPPEHTGEEGGSYIDVDVDQLIDTVYTSPTSDTWTRSLLSDVIEEYEVDCTVKQSDIYSAI